MTSADGRKTDIETVDATELVTRLLENISMANVNNVQNGSQILRSWKVIIESIKGKGENGHNLGKNLASHSRIVDFKNGILLIEADHSSWIQMLQMYQRFILTSLQKRFPELKISTLAFKLRGSSAGLSAGYKENLEAEKRKMNQNYDRQEKYLEENGFIKNTENEKIPELPPNLKELFDKMRESLLTNNNQR